MFIAGHRALRPRSPRHYATMPLAVVLRAELCGRAVASIEKPIGSWARAWGRDAPVDRVPASPGDHPQPFSACAAASVARRASTSTTTPRGAPLAPQRPTTAGATATNRAQ
eukprot:5445612-Pyramimonas_sp.AAC.1